MRQTVVVADRSLEELRHVEILLADYGLVALRATTAETAIALTVERQPDCVLIDAFMPEMDGFQAVRRLARDPRSARIPVLMMASPAYRSYKVRALWHGARDLLIKPITTAQIDAALLPLLERSVPPGRLAASR